MLSNKALPFIVEDSLNTSYIDSLFVSLFFKPSYIQNILSGLPYDIKFAYLQDMIYHNFVQNMRYRYSINTQTMNEIRNTIVMCGWKQDMDITDLYSIEELYDFLVNGFSKKKIEEKNCEKNYIELTVKKNCCIEDMLCEYGGIPDTPQFIALFLNRKTQNNKNNNFSVDIKKGIQFPGNKNNIWLIHSLICFSEGNYYSVVQDKNEWFMFSNRKFPSLVKINIKDEDMATRVKQECVFVIYTLYEDDKK